MLLLQISGTETELLSQLANTEVGRLFMLALVLMCGTLLYSVIGSSRFNGRLLALAGNNAAALDRNTAQLKAQDNRMDTYMQRDFEQREQWIVAMSAQSEVMREYTAAFLDLRAAVNTGVDTSLQKHEATHTTLSEVKGALESMRSIVSDLDSKITQELKQPLVQIAERMEVLTEEMKKNNSSAGDLVGRAAEALTLIRSATKILQLAASRPLNRSTDEWKKVQSETNIASHTGIDPAAEPAEHGIGGGSSTGHGDAGIDDRTPVVVPHRDHHHRPAAGQSGDDPAANQTGAVGHEHSG